VDGITLAKICNRLCMERGISKAQFYSAIGITAPSFHGWTKGAKPQQKYIDAIETYFDIDLDLYEESEQREELREDLKTLLKSAKDLPPSSVYELIAEIHRRKEMGRGDAPD